MCGVFKWKYGLCICDVKIDVCDVCVCVACLSLLVYKDMVLLMTGMFFLLLDDCVPLTTCNALCRWSDPYVHACVWTSSTSSQLHTEGDIERRTQIAREREEHA